MSTLNRLYFKYNKYIYNGRNPFHYLKKGENMLKMYAIKDNVSRTTGNPIVFPTDRDALDSFSQLANDEQTVINKHPKDFELWSLGEYDEREMLFHLADPKKISVASAHIN